MDGSGGRTWVLLHFTFVGGQVTTVTKIREISGRWGGGKLRNLIHFWLQNVLQVLHNKLHELLKSIALIYINRTIYFQWATISKYLQPPQGMWSPPSF